MQEDIQLSEEEQRKIFAKNLNHYIYLNGKQQKEVAKDLGFSLLTTTITFQNPNFVIPASLVSAQKSTIYALVLVSNHLKHRQT